MIHALYVDDDPVLLDICRRFLERTGEFTVETAGSGKEALARLEGGGVDVVVSDYQMPGMNGIELLSAIRRNSAIPFILFTGRGREEVVIEALNRGVDFYLQKGGDPRVQFAELASKCRQAVAHRSAERAVREHEVLMRSLLDAFPGVALLIEPDGRLLAANRAAFVAWDAVDEECTGRSIFELMGEAVEPGRRRAVAETVRSGRPVRHRDLRNGRTQDALITPIAGPGGTVERVAVFSLDITGQETGERALRAAEARASALLGFVPHPMILADPDGTILDLNGKAASLLGGAPDDLRGRCLLGLEPPGLWAGLVEALKRVGKSRMPTRLLQCIGPETLNCTLEPVRMEDDVVQEVALRLAPIDVGMEESV
ncbi:MAG TPA: response regulator [Methanoregulaceae archaeon]|nr:response regulator [Methanoregulaceae archaeon]HQJ87402.1 response regulator [Methanoregulaceae archaeon]